MTRPRGRPKTDVSKIAVVYARYSSHAQGEQSIEGQLREAHNYAKLKGYTIVHEYVDRATTGRNDQREEFQRMLHDTAKGQFGVIIVWKMDRFGRNKDEIVMNRVICKRHGVQVEYVNEKMPEGNERVIVESLFEGMAEYYSLQLSSNVRRGQRESAHKSQSIGGTRPLGYTVDPQTKQYVIDEKTAPVVRQIFKMYSEGKTVAQIIEELNRVGLRTTRGNPYTKNSLYHLLSNEKYIGVYSFKDEIRNENAIPALIDRETFDKVQEMLKLNRRAPSHTWDKSDYLLTDKLFCGHCGALMTGESGKNRHGIKYTYYSCVNRKIHHTCTKKPVRQDWIEPLVIAETVKLLNDDDLLQHIVDKTWEYYQAQDDTREKQAAIDTQLADVESKLKNVLSAIEAGLFSATIKDRLAELEQLKADLTASKADLQISNDLRLTRDHIEYFLYQFRNMNYEDRECQKRLVKTFVNAIYLFDDHMKIAYNYSGESNAVTLQIIENVDVDCISTCSGAVGNGPPFRTQSNTRCIACLSEVFVIKVQFETPEG